MDLNINMKQTWKGLKKIELNFASQVNFASQCEKRTIFFINLVLDHVII